MKAFQLVLFLLCFSCSKPDKKLDTLKTNFNYKSKVSNKVEKKLLHKLEDLFCFGDFDGDGKRDTIFGHNFSKLKKKEIIYAPDPANNDWEDIIKWFNKEDSDFYLAFNKVNRDTLYLGKAQGLYCLLNIGDNNFDGKDEIAFIVDYLDYSNLNSCKIYSLCNGKWVELKQFTINESAFDFISTDMPLYGIKDYLERKGNKWFYKDYLENKSEMQLLVINKCK